MDLVENNAKDDLHKQTHHRPHCRGGGFVLGSLLNIITKLEEEKSAHIRPSA